MIVIKMVGGLGNKMFQYALYQGLKNANREVSIDNHSFIPKWIFEKIDLIRVFPNIIIQYADSSLINALAGDQSIVGKFRRKFKLFYKKTYIRESSFRFNSKINQLEGNYYLEGDWQTEHYFKHCQNEIRLAFKFSKFKDERNIRISQNFAKEESVAIHVRKGADYLKKIVEGTCEPSYYIEAIKLIKQKVENPKFYIFTDNKDWVKKNITNIKYTIIDWNPTSGSNNYLDMQLMSLCKHNIIANSSYSWWGAWLNENPQKIVIGPKKWFNYQNKKFDTADLLPVKWIHL